jgi:hypothetical protein
MDHAVILERDDNDAAQRPGFSLRYKFHQVMKDALLSAASSANIVGISDR